MMNELKSIRVDDILYSYYECGEGPLVVCLHGFPDHPLSFKGVVNDLVAAGFRVVVPYMKGYLPTCAPENSSYQSAALSVDVAALLEALSPGESCYVFGHDWGAIAAYGAALISNKKIKKLIVASVPYGLNFASGLVNDFDQIKRSFYIWFFQTQMAEESVSANNYDFIRRLWKEWSPDFTLSESCLNELCEMFSKDGVVKSALSYYKHTFTQSLHLPEHRELQSAIFIDPILVPTLIIYGEKDTCIGIEYLDGMEESFPLGLSKIIIKGAGHFVHAENPRDVAREICNFINKPVSLSV
tara:strand:- start:2079 stop:2975 length:897 start_codon:yes stop_codon:yes gene_type:complete